ncbi:MAG TPA: hypothetical protein VFD58_35825 [Blastocatellia bacterium]|nr:hypothetical protein [Blastocatellia bacterium]
MKNTTQLQIRSSGRRRSTVKLALLSACAVFAFTLVFNPASRSQADGAEPSAEKPGMKVPLWLPADVWESLIPKDNPLTLEKVAFGEKLFFDKRLSVARTLRPTRSFRFSSGARLRCAT